MAFLPEELIVNGGYRPARIGDLVKDILAMCQDKKAKADPVLTAWQQVLPPGLAQHCRVKNVVGTRLHVLVDTPAYLYEMQLCNNDVLRAMQGLCSRPRIDSIKLSLG